MLLDEQGIHNSLGILRFAHSIKHTKVPKGSVWRIGPNRGVWKLVAGAPSVAKLNAVPQAPTEKETELLKASGLKAIEIGIELKALRAEAGLDDPDATVEQIQESFNAKQEVENSLYDLQLEQNQERFDNGLILEEERNAQKELFGRNFLFG